MPKNKKKTFKIILSPKISCYNQLSRKKNGKPTSATWITSPNTPKTGTKILFVKLNPKRKVHPYKNQILMMTLRIAIMIIYHLSTKNELESHHAEGIKHRTKTNKIYQNHFFFVMQFLFSIES